MTTNRLNKQDFYAWAYDDLFTNTTRGVLAEYIVATALGICDTKRVEWNQYDLEIEEVEVDGVRINDVGIEVKSAAYVQAWEQARPSEIVFSIRPARGWDKRTNTTADSATRSAKVYVFCVLEGKVKKAIDPLDVTQWTFYVVPTAVLEREVPTRKTIRLERLQQLAEGPRTYDQLGDAIRQAAAENQRG